MGRLIELMEYLVEVTGTLASVSPLYTQEKAHFMINYLISHIQIQFTIRLINYIPVYPHAKVILHEFSKEWNDRRRAIFPYVDDIAAWFPIMIKLCDIGMQSFLNILTIHINICVVFAAWINSSRLIDAQKIETDHVSSLIFGFSYIINVHEDY